MKKVKTLLLGLVVGFLVVVVLLAIVGLFLPKAFDVSRSVEIAAAPEQVHVYVNDLTRWPAWEPWSEGDPSIVTTIGTPSSGVGANQSWTSDHGDGKLVITESDPQTGARFDLWFGAPDAPPTKAGLNYAAGDSGSTTVTWHMTGVCDVPVIGGYFARMIASMSGPAFESGLAKLKTAVESDGTLAPDTSGVPVIPDTIDSDDPALQDAPALPDADADGDQSAVEATGDAAVSLLLSAPGENTIAVIKELRTITGLGLADAKALVDGAPGPILANISLPEAQRYKEQLEAVGATVEIR